MLNIDTFTTGKEFKDDTGGVYKITSNMFDGKKGFVEYDKVDVVAPSEEFNLPLSEV